MSDREDADTAQNEHRISVQRGFVINHCDFNCINFLTFIQCISEGFTFLKVAEGLQCCTVD